LKETAPEAALTTPTRRPTVAALDEKIGEKIPVLDHGFVALVDYMGDDQAIVQAARVSYGRGTKRSREDRGLIRYLLRHHHTTPFEMCEIKVHVKLPIFVARQWIRHRTACLAGRTLLHLEDQPGFSIGEAFQMWQSGGSQRRRVESARLRYCEENTGEIETTRITDIWSTGTRPVFEVRLASGSRLRMTRDHRCLTDRGWMTLEEATGLRVSDVTPAFATEGTSDDGSDTLVRTRVFERVVSIDSVGEEATYDLSVAGPYHNFVANGLIVHNSVNEYSGRYSILDREFYVPEAGILAGQSSSNRQGRGDAVSPERAAQVLKLLKDDAESAYAHYEDMLGGRAATETTGEQRGDENEGIARELARINLPVSFYTQWYWKIDLHNLLRFIALRADAHAQYEIRVYAEVLAELTRLWVPDAYEAFVDYQLEAASLSRMELAALKRMLKGETPDLAALGMSAREQAEFKQRFDLG
jgi:flavin-dependent thymidylate synthase